MRRPCLFCVSTDIGDVLKNPETLSHFPVQLRPHPQKAPFWKLTNIFLKTPKDKMLQRWPGLISVFNISNKTTLKWETHQNNYFIIFSWKPKFNGRWQKILTKHIYTDSWFFFRCHAGHKEKSITPGPIIWKYLPEANNNNLLSKPDKFIFSEKTNIGWQKSANHVFCPQALNQSKSL